MVIDLCRGQHPRKILRMFHARGVDLGRQNPSIYVLLPAGADPLKAAQDVYQQRGMHRGLNCSLEPYPPWSNGEQHLHAL